ncbi:hypothetical protein DM01DRAFT_1171055 [Hesseltinella vesiculosa]|uniref:Uncharacterized protein n=1 Tax=Hesseltinella vesiculosa TaxID=101127 RepID=A0A1X2G6D5_9FUNG|nr:hypothetical protein DM01DRAFT_1171055 [Hesseltinella vesiculosa]
MQNIISVILQSRTAGCQQRQLSDLVGIGQACVSDTLTKLELFGIINKGGYLCTHVRYDPYQLYIPPDETETSAAVARRAQMTKPNNTASHKTFQSPSPPDQDALDHQDLDDIVVDPDDCMSMTPDQDIVSTSADAPLMAVGSLTPDPATFYLLRSLHRRVQHLEEKLDRYQARHNR